MKLRVDPAIHIHFDFDAETGQRSLIVEHLRHATCLRLLSPAALRALSEASQWLTADEYLARLAQLGLPTTRAQQFLEDALAYGLLQQCDSGDQAEQADEDDRARRWAAHGNWLTHKLRLAKANQIYLDYETPEAPAAEEALMRAYRAESPPPSIYKEYEGSAQIALGTMPAEAHLGGLDEIARPPQARPLTLAWLARLLQHAFAATGRLADSIQGELLLKTYPSGGARHPIECYLVCDNLQGLPSGVYHYSVKQHALEVLTAVATPEVFRAQLFPHLAPALLIILTIIPERVLWRYREPTALGVMMLDLGHATENFVLACRSERLHCARNLAPWPDQLARRLGLSAWAEWPLATIAIGHPCE